jgi:hypothetical protein
MAEQPAAPMMPGSEVAAPRRGRRHWTLADIPFERVPRAPAAAGSELFYMVAAASLMEAATDLYTRNLVEFFRGDAEVTAWLEQFWLPEELQHGQGLRRYVEAGWSDFDWETAFRAFHAEFVVICEKDGLEAQRSLEMASRCVVEMGTASYYTTLSRASPEPVLALLARLIAEDEIGHYKHFYRYYRKYQPVEAPGRGAVAAALWRRLTMTDGDDSYTALKHVHLTRFPGAGFDRRDYRALRSRARALVGGHFPYPMSVKMLLKPLALGPRTTRLATPLLAAVARRFAP